MPESPTERFLRRAIELSRGGFPAPNPHVGCVIVHDGDVVGEGFHEFAGGPHAEVVALTEAGEKAMGAEVFVTLEPCNHQGRTPACSEALIAAGVARVFIACSDPNPKAAGGAERLREAGIEVVEGVLTEEAREANIRFLLAMAQQRPYVVCKAAVTLDGRIAASEGSQTAITGKAAVQEGHRLRAEMGVVIVGRKTVEIDDPQLTARIEGVQNQPLRIVLDPQARLSGKEKAFEGPGLCWRIVAPGHEGAIGAFVLPCEAGKLDLHALMAALWDRGATGLLVEGGGETIRGFLDAGLVNRIELFIAPKVFGAGTFWFGTLPFDPSRQGWRIAKTKVLGPDLQVGIDVLA